jgi:serine kinase of HPr protein (carbohydrate metabolism regulator)
LTTAIIDALLSTHRVLIAGPSGAGKSAAAFSSQQPTRPQVWHAACSNDAASTGILRRRLPVAAQIALTTLTELYEHLSQILALE